MDEQRLKDILSRLEGPEPSKEAQNQALMQALAAFDKKTQGKAAKDRLTDISFIHNVRSFFMQKKYILSGLAGAVSLVAIMAVIGPNVFMDQYSIGGGGARKFATPSNAGATTFADVGQNIISSGTSNPVSRALDSMLSSKSEGAGTGQERMAAAPSAPAPARQRVAPAVRGGGAQTFSSVGENIISAPGVSVYQPADMMPYAYKDTGRDKFQHEEQNAVKSVAAEPVSTFSIDVDTSSYSFMRRMINMGQLPPKDAVRPEEMINYFPYNYPVADSREEPFRPTVTVVDAPWKKGDKLVHIGIKGYDIVPTQKPRSNLVFLIDVSGSMTDQDKLPLLKNSLRLLLDTLGPEDTVGIVTYAGRAGTLLEPTAVSEKNKILRALDSLVPGGSTAGAAGIREAYRLAEENMADGGVNRVILATDGDFNVGITNQDELKSYIEREREAGVFLSVLGFGQGNYNDSLMQALAQNGNGNAAYIDSLSEARKVLVEEASSTLFTIAKDVKIQVEFNPATVKEYRLIGYETRRLNREDFNNDKVDAGDIGSGHTVTAIYQITPVNGGTPIMDDLRYGAAAAKEERAAPAPAPQAEAQAKGGSGNEYAFLKIRYKLPQENTSHLITRPIVPADEVAFDAASEDTRFSVAVAGFAELLKGSKYTGTLGYDDVVHMAEGARGKDEFGYRAEFLNLVRLAKTSSPVPQQ